eukprot:m.49927 g.49927  ORF g.49927 m.49927 type:complete len:560 (+) comp10640_c0_seq2:87-1766(+)
MEEGERRMLMQSIHVHQPVQINPLPTRVHPHHTLSEDTLQLLNHDFRLEETIAKESAKETQRSGAGVGAAAVPTHESQNIGNGTTGNQTRTEHSTRYRSSVTSDQQIEKPKESHEHGQNEEHKPSQPTHEPSDHRDLDTKIVANHGNLRESQGALDRFKLLNNDDPLVGIKYDFLHMNHDQQNVHQEQQKAPQGVSLLPQLSSEILQPTVLTFEHPTLLNPEKKTDPSETIRNLMSAQKQRLTENENKTESTEANLLLDAFSTPNQNGGFSSNSVLEFDTVKGSTDIFEALTLDSINEKELLQDLLGGYNSHSNGAQQASLEGNHQSSYEQLFDGIQRNDLQLDSLENHDEVDCFKPALADYNQENDTLQTPFENHIDTSGEGTMTPPPELGGLHSVVEAGHPLKSITDNLEDGYNNSKDCLYKELHDEIKHEQDLSGSLAENSHGLNMTDKQFDEDRMKPLLDMGFSRESVTLGLSKYEDEDEKLLNFLLQMQSLCEKNHPFASAARALEICSSVEDAEKYLELCQQLLKLGFKETSIYGADISPSLSLSDAIDVLQS